MSTSTVLTLAACIVYTLAIVLANGLIATFGPWISPLNSFMLIGLDLALRDWLQLRLKRIELLAVIMASGLVTWGLNVAPERIAIASAAAFIASAVVDWGVFSALWRRPWIVRSNGSNVAGAAVDSLMFPTLAFGVLMPGVVLAQFAAKVAGGALWSWVINRCFTTTARP